MCAIKMGYNSRGFFALKNLSLFHKLCRVTFTMNFDPSCNSPSATQKGFVKKYEFVNFDILLPSTTSLSMDEYSFKVNPGAYVTLVPKTQSRPKVFDLTSWLTA